MQIWFNLAFGVRYNLFGSYWAHKMYTRLALLHGERLSVQNSHNKAVPVLI